LARRGLSFDIRPVQDRPVIGFILVGIITGPFGLAH
jgi:hypothetical protein